MYAIISVLLTLNIAAAEPATVRVDTRAEFLAALADAQPGTTILLEPGVYRGGIDRHGVRGTRERPIVIAAADPEDPPIIEGGASCLRLSDPAYVELRSLVLSRGEANGLNIDDGGSPETPAHHITLSGLIVRDIGPRGNRDGIKLSGVDDVRLVDCTVERWGDSGSGVDMVGCHESTVERCTFRNAGADFANGVQAKGGSRGILIRRCRFADAGGRGVNIGGSTGPEHFRPRPQGYEAQDITVEDCTFTGSMAPVVFVGVDGAVVRHNTIYRPTRWVVRILQENQDNDFVPCRNGQFINNVVAFRSDEIRSVVNIGDGTAPETFTFADNVWHCLDRPAATRDLVRLPVREAGGTYGEDPRFRAPEEDDLTTSLPAGLSAGVRPLPAADDAHESPDDAP